MPHVSCISVTYGPTPEIFTLLESVQRHAGDISYDMTVVTQPSDGGSMAEEISRWVPWVRVIALDSNIGFGPANNLAAEQVSEDGEVGPPARDRQVGDVPDPRDVGRLR